MAAFINITFPALSPDPSADANGLAAETNALLRILIAQGTNGNDNSTLLLPPPYVSPPFKPSTQAIQTNCLLLSSLCLALLAAFGIVTARDTVEFLPYEAERHDAIGGRSDSSWFARSLSYTRLMVVASVSWPGSFLIYALVLFFWGLWEHLRSVDAAVSYTVLGFTITLSTLPVIREILM